MITDVYNIIKILREKYISAGRKIWTNISISIENFQFKIEFDYENLQRSEFNSYQRHVIWRYNYLKEGIDVFSRKDKKIKETYNHYLEYHDLPRRDVYVEGIYAKPVKNIIDFEKTLTVEEAIAQSKTEYVTKEKKKNGLFKKNKIDDIIDSEEDEIKYNNQILNWRD